MRHSRLFALSHYFKVEKNVLIAIAWMTAFCCCFFQHCAYFHTWIAILFCPRWKDIRNVLCFLCINIFFLHVTDVLSLSRMVYLLYMAICMNTKKVRKLIGISVVFIQKVWRLCRVLNFPNLSSFGIENRGFSLVGPLLLFGIDRSECLYQYWFVYYVMIRYMDWLLSWLFVEFRVQLYWPSTYFWAGQSPISYYFDPGHIENSISSRNWTFKLNFLIFIQSLNLWPLKPSSCTSRIAYIWLDSFNSTFLYQQSPHELESQ